MKKNLIALILLSFVASVTAAETEQQNYVGILYGQVESEDVETGNIGFVLGSTLEQGFGFEVFYTTTIDEDEISSGPVKADISTDTYGILATYKFGNKVYFKVKGGYAVVDLEFDFDGFGSIDDDTSDFAYGVAVGAQFDTGSLELNYLVLPEFDEFQGLDVDAEVDMISIGYNWDF